jgi:WD40 repeat protein
MHRLKVLLQADDLDIKYNTYSGNTKNEIIHMRNYLRKILEQPEFQQCLIVLTDIQDEQITKAFDLNCKMFITTRHIEKLDYIPKERKTTINIDNGFELHESLELFALNDKVPDDMKEFIGQFHSLCKGHPFIMSIIAKTFKILKISEKTRRERCEKWINNLVNYDLKDEDIQSRMPMEESLKFLTPHEQICYKKMSIFPDNSDIPFSVLGRIWDTEDDATERIVSKLLNYSLIEKSSKDETESACSLHYLHFHFLKQYVSESEQQQFHRHLIDKYELQKILRERRELDLDFPNDDYFHYYIPYHLVGAKMEDYFDLYFDFGFLEQKMRFTKLPNTVGDLIRFKKQITRNEPNRESLLNELTFFLAKSEQLIFKSDDVNLLQCALTSSGVVQKEAQAQAEKYRNRVWMEDLNHEENQTQIVQLSASSQPQLVRFVKPNENLVCLISLQDNNILLHDISQDYIDDPILYCNELPSTITDMKVFRNHAFLTLNDVGKLSVYTLKHNMNRRLSRPILHFSQNDNIIQRIDNAANKITCFNVFEIIEDSAQPQTDLIVGTVQGIIKFYHWKSSKFEEDKRQMIKTQFNGLFRMAHVYNDYVMLLNNVGEVRFVDLINSGTLGTNCMWNRLDSPINLHQGTCIHTKRPVTLCVSRKKVVQVTHQTQKRCNQIIFLDVEDVFVAEDEFSENEILSSTMSKDAEYLILGTTRGIIVIDRFEKTVVCRRNVSDQVLSLDIYRYHDEALYILSSVFKDAGHVISLHGFDSNREEYAMMSNEMTLFVGEDLFDINKSLDEWKMVAIDYKSNIHFRTSKKVFSVSVDKKPFEYYIKKIVYNNDKIIVGCTNGSVYLLDNYDLSRSKLLADLRSEITYLECFDGEIIASCNSVFKIIGNDREYIGKVTKAFRYSETELILIRKDCAIQIINLSTGNISENQSCSAQAFCGSLLALSTEQNSVYIFRVERETNVLKDMKRIEAKSNVTALAISPDKNVLAVGYANGCIGVR